MSRSAAIIGASGVVGGLVVRRLLAHPELARVVALGRRPLPHADPRLVSKVSDLQQIQSMEAALDQPVEVAISCLGTTIKQAGSQAAFRAVDHDAVLAFAQAARARGAARFVLVSSLGADPRASNFYLKTKGEVEAALARLGFDAVIALRPSLIDDQGARQERRLGERVGLALGRAAFAVLGPERRYAPIPADTIAAALVHLAMAPTNAGFQAVESDRLHALARA